jgi:hypothetical protein
MKSTLRHTVPLLLALCVLLGSVGIALSEQLCLITGMKKADSLALEDGCCQEKGPATEEDTCCTEEVSFTNLETASSQKITDLTLLAFFQSAVKLSSKAKPEALATDQRILTYSDTSPPLYGRGLLHRFHVLIV